MTGVHVERLNFCHRSEVLHREQILRPVLEYGAVATVRNQLVRMLCDGGVQVVLNHCHDGCGLK